MLQSDSVEPFETLRQPLVTPSLMQPSNCYEIGKNQIVSCKGSSATHTHCISKLFDNNLNTFWQSAAYAFNIPEIPHSIEIQFCKLRKIDSISLRLANFVVYYCVD